MREVLVNCLFKLAQEKVWLGELTVRPSIAIDLGSKATKQTKTKHPLNPLVRLLQTWPRGYPSNLVIHLGSLSSDCIENFESCERAQLPPIKFQYNLFNLC